MVWAFAEEGWQIYWTKAVEDEVARQEVLVVSNLVVLWQRASNKQPRKSQMGSFVKNSLKRVQVKVHTALAD